MEREAPIVLRVDELLGGRRNRGEDPEPGERILMLVDRDGSAWNGASADATEPVAAGDEVAAQLAQSRLVATADEGVLAGQLVEADVIDLEQELPAGGQPGANHVLHDLLLAVDGDRAAVGQVAQGDPVPPPVEAQLETVMYEPSRCRRSPRPDSTSRSTVPCSSTPARIRCSTY